MKNLLLLPLLFVSALLMGQTGAALNFIGLSSGGNNSSINDYVTVSDNGSLDLGNTYTIESWVFLTDNVNNTIIDKGDYRYLFQTHPNGNTGLGLYNTTMGWKYSNGGAVPTNTWCHVAVTFDVANNQVRFYLNGNQLGSTLTGISSNGADNGPINIGRQSPTSCFCNAFDGTMDELRVWNRVQSQCEIQSNMNCEIPTTATGLVANYHFNQGANGGNNSGVNTLTDVSGNNNNGTLTNFALTGSTSNWVAPGGVTTGINCATYVAPEINLLANGSTITDGDISPSTSDFTDFGTVASGSTLSRAFTIQNTGALGLVVSNISVTGVSAARFAVSGITFPTTISASSSQTFTVTFSPTLAGIQFATINVINNDCDEATYDFEVIGNSACPTITTSPSGTIGFNTSSLSCNAVGTYSVVASPVPVSYSYTFTGATTGTGTGTGSGLTFNRGLTNVTVSANNLCASTPTTVFRVLVTDNSSPIAICQPLVVPLADGTATVTGSQLNNGSTDNCGIVQYDCIVQDVMNTNFLNGVNSGGVASVRSYNFISPASSYAGLGGTCASSWQPEGTLCDEGVNLNSQTISTKTSPNSGATWVAGGATGVGVLVVDISTVRTINKLSVFQMFSDGKTTHFRAYSHPSASSTAPAFNDAGWVPLFTEGVVGPGALSGNDVSLPTDFNFSATNTRYLKFEARNDGRYANPGYIELRNVKAFGTASLPCNFTTANIGSSIPVRMIATDASGNQTNCNTSVSITAGPQEILVQGNSNAILDGTTTVTSSNNTDFGAVVIGSNMTRDFIINNQGGAVLTISGISFTGADASRYTVVSPTAFPFNIAAGSSQTLTIRFTPLVTTAANAVVNISNNDTNEGNYDFALQRSGICNNPTTPGVNASQSAICPGQTSTLSITSGTLNSATNWTWYSTSCGGTLLGTGTSLVVTPTVTTSYFVRGEGACVVPGSCASLAVTINPSSAAPTAVSATPANACSNVTRQLTATSPTGQVNWYTSPTGGTPFATVSSGTNVPVNPTVTTVYYAESAPGTTYQVVDFTYIGALAVFTVPVGVTQINLNAFGAQGGNSSGAGGLGAFAYGTINVTPGQELFINVGGQNGYNGGGFGYYGAGNGGGATDIRLGGTGLNNRVIVAGGGGGGGLGSGWTGGGGGFGSFFGAQGGSTNGYTGTPGSNGAFGGTQTAGGNASNGCGCGPGVAGTLGQGGNGVPCTNWGFAGGGGGGGGYFGGGGGGVCGGGDGGGGGSSYIAGLSNANVTGGLQGGNGWVRLAYDMVLCQSTSRTAVTVSVNSTPTFSVCPSNIVTANDAGNCNKLVNYTVTTAGIPTPTLSYSFSGASSNSGSGNGSGSIFNIGLTTVVISATNSCGTATCTFTVQVNDTQAPVISCAPNVTINNTPGLCSGTTTLVAPTVTDNCSVTTSDNALDFDGNSDFVVIPHNANLNLSNATFETWVKWDGSGNIGNIFMKGDYGWGVGIRSDGIIEWWQQFSQNAGLNSTGVVPVGTWTHIAVAVT